MLQNRLKKLSSVMTKQKRNMALVLTTNFYNKQTSAINTINFEGAKLLKKFLLKSRKIFFSKFKQKLKAYLITPLILLFFWPQFCNKRFSVVVHLFLFLNLRYLLLIFIVIYIYLFILL